MNEEHDLTIRPISKLIRQISMPVAIGFFFNTMFNVVDTFFGGKLGTEALAAMSLSFPLFFLIIIFDAGISNGTTAVIANALGAKEHDKAKHLAAQSISFAIILGILITVIAPLLSPALFRLLGAEANYLGLAVSYINTIFYGAIFFLMISVFSSFLQAVGNTKVYRNFLIGGFFLNILLDPWFLYGGFGIPAMGLRGVALATVVIQAIGMIYVFLKCKKTGLISKETIAHLKPKWQSFKEIGRQVIPASTNLLTIGVGIFIITYFISKFGQEAVAAYGIATRVEQIALLPTIGLTIAALSIIGQNNGAKKFDRVKETLKKCLRYGISIMAVGAVLVFTFSNFLMEIFTNNSEVIRIGGYYLKIASVIFIAYPILFITISALQGMKKPMYAVWIGLYRQILAPIILFYVATKIFDFGLNGIWWSIFATVWSAAIITIIYARKVFRKI